MLIKFACFALPFRLNKLLSFSAFSILASTVTPLKTYFIFLYVYIPIAKNKTTKIVTEIQNGIFFVFILLFILIYIFITYWIYHTTFEYIARLGSICRAHYPTIFEHID